MQTSVARSKLALNTILLLSIFSSLFLTGCSTRVSNQPTSFCEHVDPNSKYYSPNSLTLEQLNTCRMQAEKILAIQSMQIQIHRQRDEVITAANINSPSDTEISKALNSLSSETTQQNSNANASSANVTSSNQKRAAGQTQAERKRAANQSTTRIIAQQTPTSSSESIQQRYLNAASATPAPSNNTQNRASSVPSASKSQYDAEQAARVAKQIDSLLQSETTQAALNQPKALLPGEETTKVDLIAQISNRNTKIAEPINKTETNEPKAIVASQVDNKVQTPTQSITNEANPSTTQTSTTQLNTPSQNTGKLSTDYTSSPNVSSTESLNSTSNTNPVAEIVRPTDTTNINPVNAIQNKGQMDYYDPTPLPALHDTTGSQSSTKSAVNQPDPLAHLQQKRTENK
ncbi:hypothetical protein [Thorsellia anophelis]|uniref:Uncharacterized protein n=1 Tax=Thorsellia anophelis DSM 18579 TaxID=1123402 RepID=A0A1I0A6Z1_9GAMM|nr:hypothetical protein [Thorsellia anophelis]SES89924.1 hypothetical protein SAMN02583745_00815 [Thorsellia anophelis DSM 18579]